MNMDRNGAGGDRRGEELERRLIQALEMRPSVRISEDFAVRVASKAPAGLAARGIVAVHGGVGRRVAWISAALLLVVMLALAPSAGIRMNQWFEVGLAFEFAALTAWLALRPSLKR